MLDVPRELGCLPLHFGHIRSISESVRPHRVVRIASSGPKSGWSCGVDPRMGPAERRLGGGRRSCRFARRASWLMPLRAHTRGSPRPPSIAWARQGARPARRANPRAKRPASGRERVYESATLRRAPASSASGIRNLGHSGCTLIRKNAVLLCFDDPKSASSVKRRDNSSPEHSEKRRRLPIPEGRRCAASCARRDVHLLSPMVAQIILGCPMVPRAGADRAVCLVLPVYGPR